MTSHHNGIDKILGVLNEHYDKSPSCATVRRATPNDAKAIVAGINEICVEGGAFYITHFALSAQWEDVLYRPDTVPAQLLAVIEYDGSFAGAGTLFSGRENTLCSHVAELGMFIVQPYRRRGLGRKLLTWMLDWAMERGLEKVTLSVFSSNRPAIELYEQFGFVIEGCQKRQIKTRTSYVDMILMARSLI